MGPEDKTLDDYDSERDSSVLDDINSQIEDDHNSGRISDENYDDLKSEIRNEINDANDGGTSSGWPDPKSDHDDDTPFGTGD